MFFQYRVSSDYLRTQTLVLSVWHHDTFGRNNFLGEVDTDLSKWDFDHTHMNDLPLRARVECTHKHTYIHRRLVEAAILPISKE